MDGEQNVNGGSSPVDSQAAGAIGDNPETATSLEDALNRAQAQAAEYLDLLQRERANFINFRRRAEQERQETQQYATQQLIKKLLPVVDDFGRALAAAPDPRENPWVTGLALIERKLTTLLENEGVTPIDALHQPFDPNLHEAVEYEGGEGEDVVVDELSRGYKMRDRVIRPAMVRVGKRNA
jgi:molecular chaperone GrpE